jgi:DNA-binding MarR family transcriptional regulator
MEIRDTAAHEAALGVLIKETQALLNQGMDGVLRPLGLTVSQYACLTALSQDPEISGSELARRTFVSRQSANVLLQGLERRGLIERAEDLGPHRGRAITLTDDASSLLPQAHAAVAQVTARMTAALTPSSMTRLTDLLTTCRDGLA